MNYGIKGFHPLEIINRRWDIDRKSRTSASGRRDCPSDLKGADPQRKYNGVSALEGARSRGHWLAVELMESRLS
jgi:hypothetical protein